MQEYDDIFFALFDAGDVDGAAAFLAAHGPSRDAEGHAAHPLLRACVERLGGRCHRAAHRRVAELLLPVVVRDLRDALLADDIASVRSLLSRDRRLIHADLVAGRGLSQPLHHWRAPPLGKLLIDTGANIDALTTHGDSAVALQLRFGTLEGARLLLEQGADPNRGVCPHMPSASLSKAIELLLAHGFDIDRGHLLHDANHGHGSRIRIWLGQSADPNARTEEGSTALYLLAARGKGVDAIRALVAAGADLQARDALGRTPLEVARRARRDSAASALEEAASS